MDNVRAEYRLRSVLPALRELRFDTESAAKCISATHWCQPCLHWTINPFVPATHRVSRPNLVLALTKVRLSLTLYPRERLQDREPFLHATLRSIGCVRGEIKPALAVSRNNLQIFMFVKQLRLSRSELHFCGSNFEVVQQIANLKVLNISECRRDVSALVFLAVRLTKTGKEQRKGGNVERCVLAMSKLGIVAASLMEIRHTCRWYDGCGPHELWQF